MVLLRVFYEYFPQLTLFPSICKIRKKTRHKISGITLMKGDKVVELTNKRPDLLLLYNIFRYRKVYIKEKYSLQGTTQGRYLTGGVPPVRFSM